MRVVLRVLFLWLVVSQRSLFSAAVGLTQQSEERINKLHKCFANVWERADWNSVDWLKSAYSAAELCRMLEGCSGLPSHIDANFACACKDRLTELGHFDGMEDSMSRIAKDCFEKHKDEVDDFFTITEEEFCRIMNDGK